MVPFAAVVLTGGTGARMGGADKAALRLAGATLLERALAATAAATDVVVVGDPVPTSRPVAWTREEPRHGGPAAALLAGLDRLDRLGGPPALVAVLAVDMPQVTAATVARLVAAVAEDDDGALLVDASGHRQPLCGVYRAAALHRVRPAGSAHGVAVRRLLAPLRLAGLAAVAEEAADVDTWADLERLRDGLRSGASGTNLDT